MRQAYLVDKYIAQSVKHVGSKYEVVVLIEISPIRYVNGTEKSKHKISKNIFHNIPPPICICVPPICIS